MLKAIVVLLNLRSYLAYQADFRQLGYTFDSVVQYWLSHDAI